MNCSLDSVPAVGVLFFPWIQVWTDISSVIPADCGGALKCVHKLPKKLDIEQPL